MRKTVRLDDIAKKLNLTKVSVSKALRDHPDISQETIKKVKIVAEELGYRPNRLAQSLTSKKTNTIGLVMPKIAHYFSASVVEGIYRAADERGYQILLGVSFESEELQRKNIESMMNLRVDGLLVTVCDLTQDPSIFEAVKNMGIDLVFFDRGFVGSDVSFVKVADRISAMNGVNHLIKLGYKKIAHLAGRSTTEIGSERRAGYKDALEQAGLDYSEDAVIEGGFSSADGYKGFSKLVEKDGIPEAVFVVTYPVGLGVLEYMKDHGIPGDKVKILAFGTSQFNQYLSHPFICIDQPSFDLGRRAFEVLLDEMQSKKTKQSKIIEMACNVIDDTPVVLRT